MTRVYLAEVGGQRPYRVSYHPDEGGKAHYTEHYETMIEAQQAISAGSWQQVKDQHAHGPGGDRLFWAKI